MDGPRVLGRYWGKVPVVVAEDVAPCDLICLMQYTDQISMHATARLTCDYGDSRKSADPMELGGEEVWLQVARLGRADCNVFRYSPFSRHLGSLTPTQPGRVTKPTQSHPGSPWGAPQVECWSLRREPQPPAQHGSCAAERCRSRARPGQRLPPCMHSGGTSRHFLVTSPKRARAI